MGKHNKNSSNKKSNGDDNRNRKSKAPAKKSGNKGGGEQAFFRVDDSRAMKAKKNKAFVKFNKTKVQLLNQESISRLNNNLDSLQSTVRSSAKKATPAFVNPVQAASRTQAAVSKDLDAAIDNLMATAL